MEPFPAELPARVRPMGIGEILKASAVLFRERWSTLLGVAAVLIIPISAANAAFATRLPTFEPGDMPTREDLESVLSVAIVAILVQVLIAPLLTAAVSWIAAKGYLGQETGGREAFRIAIAKLLPLIWVGILTFLAIVGGLILLIIPGIIFWLRLSFGSTALIVEDLKGTRALSRSWNLSKGSMGKIFLTLIATLILVGIVQLVVGYPFTIIGEALGGGSELFFVFVGDALAGLIGTPFALVVIVLLYFDLRVRQERVDTALLGGEAPPRE